MFIEFSKAFDSILIGKMEQILLAYDLPKETATAIMMLYKNMKALVCLPDGDTDFFNIVTREALAPYLFIIGLDYVIQMSIDLIKENGFTLKIACPVSWGCRIHRLLLCRGVRPPPNECPGYDTKQSDGEVPAVLELWGMRSTPSLPSLPGSLWPGVVAPDKGPIYGLNRTKPCFFHYTDFCI